MTSLFQKIGGHDALEDVVETLYRKLLGDDRVSRFFEDVDMDHQLLKQKAFLTMVLGGPVTYTGKDMREGHRRLVERGLDDSHVDAVIEILGQSLTEHGVGADDVAVIAAIAESVRDDVLNRTR